MERNEVWALLTKYNKDHFHLQHALTVEAVMRWYANELGYGDEADFWATVGLLHDLDFEQWPEQHCKKAPELLAEIGADDAFVHAVCSHGYGRRRADDPRRRQPRLRHLLRHRAGA